jgi:hypothetical protein
MKDSILACPYCGDIMEQLTKEQRKVFGKPTCCDNEMLTIDRARVYEMIKGLDTLKSNLERETIKDFLDD